MPDASWRELWLRQARDDYDWLARRRPELVVRVDALIDDIRKRPFAGLGKPEALKGNLSGWWSRRIDREHRLVYRVSGRSPRLLEIAQCRLHY